MKFVAVAVLLLASTAAAQVKIETKTIELKHLKPAEAVRLLKPYIINGGGGVFDVSEKIPIITIRDVADNIPRMEQVLAKYDHTPATIRLVFQLIEADTGIRMVSASNTRGLSVDLDSTLRSVLRFPVYRLLNQGVATTGEDAQVRQQFGDAGEGLTYQLWAEVGTIKLADAKSGTVRMRVHLMREGPDQQSPNGSSRDKISHNVLSTSLDVPLGNTVVLGTAATRINGVALILTVKPELVSTGK